MIWQRFTAKIANNSLFKTSYSTNYTSWNNIGVQTTMKTFLSYEKFTHLLPVRQLCKLCWWKIFAKIHRQSLQIALIFKILFQKPTRLSVFGKKFDPADLVTRDVSHCYFLVYAAYTLDFIRLTWQAIRVFTTQDKI